MKWILVPTASFIKFTIMPRISDGVMNLINAAKEKGMIFYRLGINISEITDCQVYEVIDKMWFYQNNICYKIYDKITKLG